MLKPTLESPACLFDRLSPDSRQRIACISVERARLMLDCVRTMRDQALQNGKDEVLAMVGAIDQVRAAEIAEIKAAALCEDWPRLYASSLLLSAFIALIDVRRRDDVDRVLSAMEFMASLKPPSQGSNTIQ